MRISNQNFVNKGGLPFYSLNQLAEDIKNTFLPLSDSLWSMLNLNTEEVLSDGTLVSNYDSQKSFITRLNLAIKNYSELYPIVLSCDISELDFKGMTDSTFSASRVNHYIYEFKSNFEDVIDGLVDKERLVLLPLQVTDINLATSFYQNHNFWDYDKNYNRLYVQYNTGKVIYNADTPLIYEFSPAGGFTDESAIFMVQHPDTFFNIVSLHILRHIDELHNSVQLPGTPPVVNLTEHLTRLQQDVQAVNLITAAAGFAKMWVTK